MQEAEHDKAMLAELDHLVARSGDEQSQLSWLYIKHIVTRGHAHFLKEEFGLRGQKAVNQAWSDWEDGFENDPAEFPSEYLMNSLASLWNDSAPIKHPGEWGFWLEVALGLGRGIPRKEAIEDQNKFLAEQGGEKTQDLKALNFDVRLCQIKRAIFFFKF